MMMGKKCLCHDDCKNADTNECDECSYATKNWNIVDRYIPLNKNTSLCPKGEKQNE
jgi:hypothetical protein